MNLLKYQTICDRIPFSSNSRKRYRTTDNRYRSQILIRRYVTISA